MALARFEDLKTHARALQGARIAELFDVEPDRLARFALDAAGLHLDASKNKLTGAVLDTLMKAFEEAGAPQRIEAMFAGAPINTTENRAVLHTALRAQATAGRPAAFTEAADLAKAERERMLAFVRDVHEGRAKGFTGEPLDTVVNIGIGGSDLGPLMVTEALKPYGIEGRRSFFVSNVDGQHITDTLAQTTPERTLFLIASKTFTTQETMMNARTARDWFLKSGAGEAALDKHFAALSTNADAVKAFGVDPERMFIFWDWVGGRYSLWSSIGLSIALQAGAETFERLLKGAHAMDEHFRTADLSANMPALLAAVGVWNRNFLGMSAHAVLPYDQHLHRLAAYLQQADMESNGKSMGVDGARVGWATGPVIFGEPGTNGQHAFHQLLHQGTDKISADLIAPARSHSGLDDHHQVLLANVLAQSRALMLGRSLEDIARTLREKGMDEDAVRALAPHRTFEGDRPTNTILMEALTPETLGALVALYEHKIFVQGVYWGINSFDQWGVELGKELAKEIEPEMKPGATAAPFDASTNALLAWLRARREG